MLRSALLHVSDTVYTDWLRPVIFRSSAQDAHERMMRLLRWADYQAWLDTVLGFGRWITRPQGPAVVGSVALDAPLILAAGLVKGDGFTSEEAALAAVQSGHNIIPGWRCVPRLVGLVEYGSFTRWPRVGNPGTVVWRDVATHSTQNRIGLRNPGVKAAAAFLGARADHLPDQFGINIAISPGLDDPDQQTEEVLAGLRAFIEAGVFPTWFTLNLSCPNTEDDPSGNQTADQTRQLCRAAVHYLRESRLVTGRAIPLWVKIGPTLSVEQYHALMGVFAETGVRAVIATNTFPAPTPDDPTIAAGIAGGRLHDRAVETAAILMQDRVKHAYPVDVIGCGGVQDCQTYQNFRNLGIEVVQYWSALVYRGPLAAALIMDEVTR
jgi:dihydroorotate dehydrogenase